MQPVSDIDLDAPGLAFSNLLIKIAKWGHYNFALTDLYTTSFQSIACGILRIRTTLKAAVLHY